MATKNPERMIATDPDRDDDGHLDVEHYPIPDGSGITDEYLRRVWDDAISMIESGQLDDHDD